MDFFYRNNNFVIEITILSFFQKLEFLGSYIDNMKSIKWDKSYPTCMTCGRTKASSPTRAGYDLILVRHTLGVCLGETEYPPPRAHWTPT